MYAWMNVWLCVHACVCVCVCVCVCETRVVQSIKKPIGHFVSHRKTRVARATSIMLGKKSSWPSKLDATVSQKNNKKNNKNNKNNKSKSGECLVFFIVFLFLHIWLRITGWPCRANCIPGDFCFPQWVDSRFL